MDVVITSIKSSLLLNSKLERFIGAFFENKSVLFDSVNVFTLT